MALFRLMTNSTLVTCCTGKIGRLLAFEDAAGIDPGLSPPVGVICTAPAQEAVVSFQIVGLRCSDALPVAGTEIERER